MVAREFWLCGDRQNLPVVDQFARGLVVIGQTLKVGVACDKALLKLCDRFRSGHAAN